MEAKRSNLQTTAQYNSAGHRITPGLSKTQVAKNPSGVSLTPSQAAEQAKLNGLKHPLDALSKLPTRQQTIERRSGLQDVDEEYLKQNIFRKSLYPRNSGRNEVNAAQNQILNPPAAGQPSIPSSQTMQQNPPNPTANQTYVQAQQQNPHYVQAPQQNQPHVQVQQQNQHYAQAQQQNQSLAQAQQQNQFNQSAANLNPAQMQMQMQMQPPVQVPVGAGNVQGQQNMGQAKNQMNHAPVAAQQDFQKQINPEHSMNMNGHRAQQPGQPTAMNPNHNAAGSPPPPEPDMCTTCPNCQTTIYLVRGGAEMNNDMHHPVANNLGQQMMSENVNVGAV